MRTLLRRRITNGFITGLVIAFALSVTGGLLAGPAAAHADLVSSDPTDGAVLQAPPAAITLTFSDPLFVDSVQMSLVTADGVVVASEPPVVADTSVSLAWPAAAGPGSYEVGYRVVSEDGHPVSGSVAFTVEASAQSAQPTAAPTPTSSPAAASATPSDAATNLVPLVVAILAAAGVAVAAVVAFGRRKR